MIAILGAGLAGLSLATALTRSGVREPVVVFDGKERFDDDRTWCWWHVPGLPFADVANPGWSRWRLTSSARTVLCEDAARPYRHLPAAAFYAAARRTLAAGGVTLRLGTPIDAVRDRGRTVRLESGSQAFEARLVFDARAAAADPLAQPRLVQSVHGWFVTVARPAFDPGEATLMDFRVEQSDGLRFAYVLPFSTTTALVEHAAFARRPVARDEHERALERYLRERLGCRAWAIDRIESGCIPMDAAPRDPRPSRNVYRIGTAGGGVRASSGFAFVRIQRWSTRIARAVATRAPIPMRAGAARYDAYDRVLLALCRDRRHLGPEAYLSLFASVPAAVVARFMSDASTWSDDARVVARTARAVIAGAMPRVAARP